MTWYRTQREVCEYFGKNPDDRKFVGRKIAKGEIRKVDWGYEIVWDSVAKSVAHDTVECGNNTTVSELEGKITLLEEENKNLKARVKELEEVCKDSLFGDNNGDTVKNDDDLNTATVQWHYYENLYNEEVKDKQNRIRKAFRWIKMIKPTAKWEEFKDWIMSDEE